MQSINIYDIEYKKIEQICEERDTTPAELMEVLVSAIEDGTINLSDYSI